MERNSVKTPYNLAIAIVALAMVAYHAISTQVLLVSPAEHSNIHLAFALMLVFLVAARSTQGWLRLTSLAALALSRGRTTGLRQ